MDVAEFVSKCAHQSQRVIQTGYLNPHSKLISFLVIQTGRPMSPLAFVNWVAIFVEGQFDSVRLNLHIVANAVQHQPRIPRTSFIRIGKVLRGWQYDASRLQFLPTKLLGKPPHALFKPCFIFLVDGTCSFRSKPTEHNGPRCWE